MGSLFSQSVPRYSPVAYVPRTPAADQADQASNGGVDTINTTDNRETEEESLKDVIRRTARGRNSLIQTSYRGVLTDVSSLSPQRKNLLGE